MTIPDGGDLDWAYKVLHANDAVRLNSGLDALWADRPRYVSLEQSRTFTGTISQALADSAYMLREDLALPSGFRVYGIHDIVLNCICGKRREADGVDIVFFSGVLSVPLLRFAVQIMLSRLEPEMEFVFPEGHVGDLHEIAECALGYTIWHLIEDIPVTLADVSGILIDDDVEKLANTMDGMAQFLFLHEVGHIACGHIALQNEIVHLSAGGGPLDLRMVHEFEADEFAIRSVKPEYRSAAVLYARIFLEIIADLEALGFDFGSSHPKATARVRRLLEIFGDDIDELRKSLLTSFLDNREALRRSRAWNDMLDEPIARLSAEARRAGAALRRTTGY